MGCSFNFKTLTSTTDEDAVNEGYGVIDQCKYEDGHGGYTGTFAEASGVKVNNKVKLSTIDEAYDWLNENAEKWGAAIIVKVDGVYYMGANCSS
jgi:hypothetical protein